MRKFIVAASLVFSLFAPAAEAAHCYGPKEFEAEQGIRIHSELMVIGLTCMKMPGGPENYSRYQQFTQKNSKLIAQYETDLIRHYKSEGIGGAEVKLHTLRTTMANQISKRAIAMSTGTFCNRFSSRIPQALAMSKPQFRAWAQTPWQNSPTSEPVCKKSK